MMAAAEGDGAAAGPYQPRAILVTGGAGFIGSHTVLRLAARYPDVAVVVLDKLDYCANIRNLDDALGRPNVKFVQGDILSVDFVRDVMTSEGIDTIMHFAAQTHVDNSFGDSFVFTHTNVLGTHILLEVARECMPVFRRFVHISTDEVYGENTAGKDTFQEHASLLEPSNPYSASKAGAEMLVMSYNKSYSLPTIVCRGNNVYGPHQYPEKLIPKFLHLAMLGEVLPVHGSGMQQRSYLYVEDVASAYDTILHLGSIGETYNIGTSEEMTVLSIAQHICATYNLDPNTQIVHVEDRPCNDQRYFMNFAKLAKLGWKAEVGWAEGFAKTKDWYEKHRGYWPEMEHALRAHTCLPAMAADAWTGAQASYPKSGEQSAFLVVGGEGTRVGMALVSALEHKSISFSHAGHAATDLRWMTSVCSQSAPGRHIVLVLPDEFWDRPGACTRRQALATHVTAVLHLAECCAERELHLTVLRDHVDVRWHNAKGEMAALLASIAAAQTSWLAAFDKVLAVELRNGVGDDADAPFGRAFGADEVAAFLGSQDHAPLGRLDELLPLVVDAVRHGRRGALYVAGPGSKGVDLGWLPKGAQAHSCADVRKQLMT